MRYHEIAGDDATADARLRTALKPKEYDDVQRIIGGMRPRMKAEIIADLVRDPPRTMTPTDRARMYGADTIDDRLDRAKIWAEIIKLKADARRLDPGPSKS